VGGIRNSREFELEPGDAQQGEDEPEYRREHGDPPFERGDAVPQSALAFVAWSSETISPEATTDPAHHRGARDLQLRAQVGIPRTEDLLLDTVVLGAPGHRARRAWPSPPSPKRARDLATCRGNAAAPGCSTPQQGDAPAKKAAI